MLLGPTTVVLALYLMIALAIGWITSRRTRSSSDYLQATAALPLLVVVPAYMAANCGALEVVGLSAMAAQYGAEAFHFFWIGAVPAMLVLALWMMRIYRQAGITTVPQFLEVRYGTRLRLVNAIVTAVIALLLAGVSMYAVGQVVSVVTGMPFRFALVACDVVVVTYVLLGGIRATIYNELLQLLLLLLALAPLAWKSARILGRVSSATLGSKAHAWTALPWLSPGAPLDIFGVVMGLGCVLSFSYWCTDFVMMQRAFSARTQREAQRVPAFAAIGKLIFGFLIVLPGLAASVALPSMDGRYDHALPSMMSHVYGPWMLAVGLTSLCASLMSALAANISAFASLLVADILPSFKWSHLSGSGLREGMRWSRAAILFAGVAGLFLSSLDFFFSDLMELVQLIFSVLGVPFWSVFLYGMMSHTVDETDAVTGFACGAVTSLCLVVAYRLGFARFGSNMACDFYAAALGFSATTALTFASALRRRHAARAGRFALHTAHVKVQDRALLWACAAALILTVALNLMWR